MPLSKSFQYIDADKLYRVCLHGENYSNAPHLRKHINETLGLNRKEAAPRNTPGSHSK